MSTPTSTPPPRPSPQERRWAWRLGSVAGIDLYLHATFVALLVWIAVSHLGQRHGLPGVAGALVLNLAVFGVVVLHELGHALVARRFGINTRDITLWPIGGIARLERMPDKPRQELLVAAAGPAVNFGLAGLLAGLMFLFGRPLAPPQVELMSGSFLGALLWINISLGLFNLLPAFPMDVGEVIALGRARSAERRLGAGAEEAAGHT